MFKFPVMAFPVVLMIGVSWPVAAQMPRPFCGPHKVIIDRLVGRYNESRIGFGLVNGGNGALVELWVSATGSWTMLITKPKEPTCMFLSGEAWQNVPRVEDDAF